LRRPSWASAVTDNAFPDFKGCESAIENWKNPAAKDKITAVHAKTTQVKEQMVLALDKVLARGERIDDLVAKSDDLSESSKQFYKKSKSLNSCCLIV
jgi:synaptobrevin family protein YKT6